MKNVEKIRKNLNSRVAIIILNWNGWKDTIECLESLFQIEYLEYEIIVVDNGSDKQSIEKIRDYADGNLTINSHFFDYTQDNKPIRLVVLSKEEAESSGGQEREIRDLPSNRKLIVIHNKKNYGFAEGNNIGMRYALQALNPDYFLLLNNDTTVERHFLKELIKLAIIDDKTGLVGPKIIDYNSKKIQSVGGKISLLNLRTPFISIAYGESDEDQYNQFIVRDWLSGCCLLIPTHAIKKVGFFNGDLFAYCEDVDLSLRMKRNGYKNFYCPTAVIWHKGGASSGGPKSDFAFYLETRNKITLVCTYFNLFEKSLFLAYTFLIFPIFVTGFCAIHNDFRLIKPLYYGLKESILKRKINFDKFLPRNNK